MSTASVASLVANDIKFKPKPVKVKAKKKVNRIFFVLDGSTSMSGLSDKVIETFNNNLKNIVAKWKKTKQETYVSVLTFDSRVHPVYDNVLGGRDLRPNDYRIEGMTALVDGMGTALDKLDTLVRYELTDDVSYLVILMTDGMENASYRYQEYAIRNKIVTRQQIGNWTFVVQCPKGASNSINHMFGIPLGNITEWEQTEKGVQHTQTMVSTGIDSYYGAREKGIRSLENFCTDLSKVAPKVVHSKLDDLSDQFRVLSVTQDSVAVKEFVESKTRRPYVIGSAYYLLQKPEIIQPTKDILIMEKNKKAVWGGSEARKLIGLDVTNSVKVIPGNHSYYDIYVKSTSVNRKLQKHTKVLVDKTKVKDDKSTWDHTKVSV